MGGVSIDGKVKIGDYVTIGSNVTIFLGIKIDPFDIVEIAFKSKGVKFKYKLFFLKIALILVIPL